MNGKLLANAFPINKVEVFFDNEDHSHFLGFTWERVGAGRVPVGIDTSQTEFNTIGKTGGSKELQEHSHKTIRSANPQGLAGYGAAWGGADLYPRSSDGSYGVDHNTETAGTGNSGNLQPYIVMAFWKRIA